MSKQNCKDIGLEQARDFIAALFDKDDVVMVRLVETWNEAGQKKSKSHATEHIEAERFGGYILPELLTKAADTNSNVFFGVCPRPLKKHADLACQIRTVRAIWADLDDCLPEQAIERSKAAGVPAPSIVVSSGNGTHLYWLLSEPYAIDDCRYNDLIFAKYDDKSRRFHNDVNGQRINPADLVSPKAVYIQDIVKGVSAQIGGDSTHDISRILRIPGTLNRKDARNGKEPRPCTLFLLDTSRRYPLSDFAPFRQEPKATPAESGTAGEGQGTAGGAALPSLTGGQRAIFDGYLAKCGNAPVGQRSEADYALCKWALKCRLDAETVWQAVEDTGKFSERGRGYFYRTWDKAEADTGNDDEYLAEQREQVAEDLGVNPDTLIEKIIAKEPEQAGGDKEPEPLDGESKPEKESKARFLNRLALEFLTAHPDEFRIYRGDYWRFTGTHYEAVDDMNIGLSRWLDSRNVILSANDRREVLGHLDKNIFVPSAKPFPCWLDGNGGEVVTFHNGLYSTKTRTLSPHTPLWFSSACLPFDYTPGAACPNWTEFVNTALDGRIEDIMVLQEFLGYCLTQDTGYQKMLVLLGLPQTGKSTIAKVLMAMVGTRNSTAYDIQNLAGRFGLIPLIGRQLATMGEIELRGNKDRNVILSRLKSIVGQDDIAIERKGDNEFWTGRLPIKFVVCCNEFPSFYDTTGALHRRLIVLSFARVIDKVNPRFYEEMLAPELAGIIQWSLAGFERLQTNGRFTESEYMKNQLHSIRREQSPEFAFAQDCLAVQEDYLPAAYRGLIRTIREPAAIDNTALQERYNIWCSENGRSAGDWTWFIRSLRAIMPKLPQPAYTKRNGKTVRIQNGISLAAS